MALSQEIALLPNLGNAVRGADGFPEISDFNLEEFSIRVDQQSFSSFQKSLARRILMLSSVNSTSRLRTFLANFLKRLTEFFLGVIIGERIQSPRGVGFDDSFQLKSKTTLLIGNFHSHLWVDAHFKERLKLTQPKSALFHELESRAKIEDPVGIHVRLGDYLSIDELNVLSGRYYSNAIDASKKVGTLDSIWIFTNDPVRLDQYLPAELISGARIVDLSLTSSETLELLRNCSVVVTANSTFSWWGAFATHKEKTTIFTPARWFRTKSNPTQIIPEVWVPVDND